METAARKYLAIYPDSPELLLSAGAAFQSIGKIDDAIRIYEKRLEIIPDDAGVINNLGHCRLDRGDMEGALAEWRRIFSMPAPKHIQDTARFNLARALLLRGDIMAAESECNILCQEYPDNAAYTGLRAKIRARYGQRPEAIIEAREALEKDRGDVASWLRLGKLTGESGDLEGAFGLL
ncbi:MAG: hypothetical protein OSJ28_11145, partial [Desulfovibrio sp.]|nr:hypothetical protein [Desulfovibrio sp.]